MDIFLRYEITAREFDAHILTGLVAASRGHTAIICDWPMMMRGIFFRKRRPGFVHMNSLTPSKSTPIFHRIFKFFGLCISSLDQEAGIGLVSYEPFARVRYGEETVSSADLIFCWGRDDYETLQNLYPTHTRKFVMSGSPRVDLWRSKFADVYTEPKQERSRFVLVISSVRGPMTPRPLHQALISLRGSAYLERDSEMEMKVLGSYKEGADLTLSYLDLIRHLWLSSQDLSIILKPHPTEDPQFWRELLGETDSRVSVDTASPTSQLVRESVAVISSGSTVAFEAELSGTPLISFRPIDTPNRNSGFLDDLGIEARSVEKVGQILNNILRQEQDLSADFEIAPDADVRKKIHFEDQQLAAERMVESWERVLSEEGARPVRGKIFSLPREELKYFVASAFPVVHRLFRGEKRLVSPARFRRSYKRPPIDRKSVEIRVLAMQSILGLQNSVKFRFKGSRGLVIEPADKPNF